MTQPLFISLGYRKQHGKDVVADHLVKAYGFKKIGWADKLKAGVNEWHGWDGRHAYGDLKEVVDDYFGYSPREAYQRIGTDLMRNQWMQDFWIRCAMRQVDRWMQQGFSVVVNDSRFPNEAEAVLQADGELWRIDRPGMPAPDREQDHPSELGLMDFNGWSRVLVNDETIEDLHRKVDLVLQELRAPR